MVTGIATQLGFEVKLNDTPRSLTVDLTATGRQAPLLLFDAVDPGNLGWFSRCQFYVDGHTGLVLQTPLAIANQTDRSGYTRPNAIRVQITKELPASFRLPGKQLVSEQMIYALFYNFLNALLNTGVAVCGSTVIKALAGRTESLGTPS